MQNDSCERDDGCGLTRWEEKTMAANKTAAASEGAVLSAFMTAGTPISIHNSSMAVAATIAGSLVRATHTAQNLAIFLLEHASSDMSSRPPGPIHLL